MRFIFPKIIFSIGFIILLLPLSVNSYYYLSIKSSIFDNNISRIDFKVTDSKYYANVDFITDDYPITQITKPNWIKSEFGSGGSVKTELGLFNYNRHTVKLKADSDCTILISFIDEYQKLNNKKYPVFSKYKNITINKDKLNVENPVVGQNKIITKEIKLKKDEIVELGFSSKKHVPTFRDFDNPPDLSWPTIMLIMCGGIFLGCSFGKGLADYNNSKLASFSAPERIAYYDFLRIISILFVIFNHTDGFHCYLKEGLDQGLIQYFHIILSVITKFAVPMFFVITGALLLEKHETVGTILKKRLYRIFIVIITFTTVSYYIKYLSVGNVYSLSNFLRGLLNGRLSAPGIFSYWFLYAYMGILVVLPFLRVVAKSLNKETFSLLFTLVVIFSVILPILNLLLTFYNIKPILFQNTFMQNITYFTSTSIFYVLLGYYLDKKINILKLNRTHLILLIAMFTLAVAIALFATFLDSKIHNGKFSQKYLSCTMPFIIVSLFLFVKKISYVLPHNKFFVKTILTMGPLVFFVYLFDGPLKFCIYKSLYNTLEKIAPNISNYTVIYSLFWVITSLSVSSVICFYLRKSPRIRKYL